MKPPLGALAGFLIAISAHHVLAEDAKVSDVGFLKDRIYLVYTEESTGATLERVEITQIGGLKFLKGESVRAGNWICGKTVYLPLGKVTCIVEFESMAQYEEAKAKYDENESPDHGRLGDFHLHEIQKQVERAASADAKTPR